MQGSRRWWWGAVAALIGVPTGCSFTNEFDVPAVVRVWRNTVFTVNSDRTERRRNLLTIEEDGTGEAIIYFTLTGDDTDRLYSDTFDVAWSRDAGEYLMRLTCRSTTAPVPCTPTDMTCSVIGDGAELVCYYPILDSTYTFEPLPDEGEEGT